MSNNQSRIPKSDAKKIKRQYSIEKKTPKELSKLFGYGKLAIKRLLGIKKKKSAKFKKNLKPSKSIPVKEHFERKEARKRLYNKNPYCAYCQVRMSWKKCTLDHIIPQSMGGTHNDYNLQLLCKPCNVKKGDHMEHSPEFFEAFKGILASDDPRMNPRIPWAELEAFKKGKDKDRL